MKTQIDIDGARFLINGKLTYEGRKWNDQPIAGLLFNSRMVQAIFDDANPVTALHWRYPDTEVWDPDRNTNEFCEVLPEYRKHGLLAVTIGLQGGGSVYIPEIYDNYENSAYEPDGTFRPAYFERLLRIIKAADDCGMVVIVNYFYVKHARRLKNEAVIHSVAERVTQWLLETGFRNILVDVANESADWWKNPPFQPANIHKLIDIVQQTTLNGRRLLAGSSSGGGSDSPLGKWLEVEDFHMPHGNGLCPDELRSQAAEFESYGHIPEKPKAHFDQRRFSLYREPGCSGFRVCLLGLLPPGIWQSLQRFDGLDSQGARKPFRRSQRIPDRASQLGDQRFLEEEIFLSHHVRLCVIE